MTNKQIILRCEDGQEAAVFSKYTYKGIMELTDGEVELDDGYEIMIEDSYVGGEYKGFFGRIRRAWRAFRAKPVNYTGIYCEDKDKMRKFLIDCLALIDEEYMSNKDFPIIQMNDIIEVYNDTEMRFVCNDECEQFDGIVHPDEDFEFEEKDITKVWRQIGEDYICIYKREFYRGKKL